MPAWAWPLPLGAAGLLAVGISHHAQPFRMEGANSALVAAVVAAGAPKPVIGIAIAMLVLLALVSLASSVTLGAGRTNMMQGAVHLVLFAGFLLLSLVP
jgi:hypothetical protein